MKDTAAATAAKPEHKIFIDVKKLEAIKELGWRAERQEDNSYIAVEENSTLEGAEPRRLGPANLKDLLGMVRTEVGNSSPPETDIENFQRGPDPRLPGLEEPEIEDLNHLADVCIEMLEKRKQATTASKDADDIMRVKMHEFDRKRYSRKGWSIVIEDSEKLVIKKAEAAPPKNLKAKK